MDIQKLLEENPNINITINAGDLLKFGNTLANQTAKTILEQKEEKLYTRSEVIKMFDIAPATIWRWEKIGLIKSVRMGNRIYYPESEVKRVTNLKDS